MIGRDEKVSKKDVDVGRHINGRRPVEKLSLVNVNAQRL